MENFLLPFINAFKGGRQWKKALKWASYASAKKK